MKIAIATMGARGTDSVTPITLLVARSLRLLSNDFCCRYLSSITPAELATILSSGLAFIPFTYADQFDGATTVAQLKALGIPTGATVFLDVEGIGPGITPTQLITKINAWADTVMAAGFIAGLYVGANAQLTSAEVYALHVTRYAKSLSRLMDRFGNLVEPDCGWCFIQLYPSTTWAGIGVDLDFIQSDYQGRFPTWVVASPPSSVSTLPPSA
jgi:hypothetical protein